MQDATAQMALLQFMTAGLPQVAVPSTVHCDHLIQAKAGADIDLHVAVDTNTEVYDFLAVGLGQVRHRLLEAGLGIIHQVVLENYAFPGGMMIGTDSHTPNAGGLGMVAIGVGGADAVDVMTGFPFNVRWPKLIGVHLTGTLSRLVARRRTSSSKVAEILTVKGGTGAIVEYFGPGADTHLRHRQGHHLQHGRRDRRHHLAVRLRRRHGPLPARPPAATAIADAADAVAADLRRRPRGRSPTPARYFDQVIEIDLVHARAAHQRPPHPRPRPTRSARSAPRPQAEGWPLEISSALIGSCTNSSYEDITRAASIARQAAGQGPAAPRRQLLDHPRLRADPRHHRARRPARRPRGHRRHRAGQRLRPLHRPVGPHRRRRRRRSTPSSTRYNRNFPKRNDGNANTLAFVTSPETVVALALAGTLDFDPRHRHAHQRRRRAGPRSSRPSARSSPPSGFDPGETRLPRPAGRRLAASRSGRRPTATACSCSSPSPPWDGNDFVDLPVLMKAKGKCTTDHISAAGPWLKYRGHLENISGNLFLGAVNAFTGEAGAGQGPARRRAPRAFPDIAKHYHEAGQRLGRHRRRELRRGQLPRARRHGAPLPRRQGRSSPAASPASTRPTSRSRACCRSPSPTRPTYDQIGEDDRISVLGLADLAPDVPVRCQIRKPDGTTIDFEGHPHDERRADRAGSRPAAPSTSSASARASEPVAACGPTPGPAPGGGSRTTLQRPPPRRGPRARRATTSAIEVARSVLAVPVADELLS